MPVLQEAADRLAVEGGLPAVGRAFVEATQTTNADYVEPGLLPPPGSLPRHRSPPPARGPRRSKRARGLHRVVLSLPARGGNLADGAARGLPRDPLGPALAWIASLHRLEHRRRLSRADDGEARAGCLLRSLDQLRSRRAPASPIRASSEHAMLTAAVRPRRGALRRRLPGPRYPGREPGRESARRCSPKAASATWTTRTSSRRPGSTSSSPSPSSCELDVTQGRRGSVKPLDGGVDLAAAGSR